MIEKRGLSVSCPMCGITMQYDPMYFCPECGIKEREDNE